MITVAMKFGVGVALIVAAHFVLVKRWNNGKCCNIFVLQIILYLQIDKILI